MSDEINYYDVLGISRDASIAHIIKSYWHAKDRYDSAYLKRERDHAKRNNDEERLDAINRDLQDAPEKLRQIEEAYSVLSNYIKRKAYDVALDSTDMSAVDAASNRAVNVLLGEISADIDRRARYQQNLSRNRSASARQRQLDNPFDTLTAELDANGILVNQSSSNALAPMERKQAGGLIYTQSKPAKSGRPLIVYIFIGLFIISAIGFLLVPMEDVSQDTSASSESSASEVSTSSGVSQGVDDPTPAMRVTIEPATVAVQSAGLPTLMPEVVDFAEQATTYYNQGRFRIAVTVYSQAIAQQEAPQLFYGRALARWAFTDQQASAADTLLAISDLQQAIALDNRFADAYGMLGVLYFERWKAGLGEDLRAEAETALAQYLALNPDDIPLAIEATITRLGVNSD